MRAVLFEGTPEEFTRVEVTFRAGGGPGLLIRSIVLPQSRRKAWPELDEERKAMIGQPISLATRFRVLLGR